LAVAGGPGDVSGIIRFGKGDAAYLKRADTQGRIRDFRIGQAAGNQSGEGHDCAPAKATTLTTAIELLSPSMTQVGSISLVIRNDPTFSLA
jgi:hypothetical protein